MSGQKPVAHRLIYERYTLPLYIVSADSGGTLGKKGDFCELAAGAGVKAVASLVIPFVLQDRFNTLSLLVMFQEFSQTAYNVHQGFPVGKKYNAEMIRLF